MLLGEPSPGLAKINAMNIVKLEAKILQLVEEQKRVGSRIEKLLAREPAPTEHIERNRQQLVRLQALEKAARDRLKEKNRRKAEWEAKQQQR